MSPCVQGVTKWQNMCATLYGSSFPSGCCGAANIFQPGFSWEENECRGWRKWKVWLFLIGHSEATGKLNKRDKLKNPLWPPFPAMVIELDGMNNILMILLICGQEAIRVQWDYLLWSLNKCLALLLESAESSWNKNGVKTILFCGNMNVHSKRHPSVLMFLVKGGVHL